MRILIFILLAVSLQAQSPLYRVEWNPDEVAGAENLLLDDYPGAAAAYSLRQLREDVTNVIRIREDGTNSEQDFSAEQITDGTLAAFCGNHNGYVTTWYDQSGNNNHATQTTAANQPKIFDASTGLVMENGKPAIDFDGTNNFFEVLDSKATFKFLHDGTSSTIFSVTRIGKGGTIDENYGVILCSAAASLENGFFILYEDRAGVGSDAFRVAINKGLLGTFAVQSRIDNVFTPNEQLLQYTFLDADNVTAIGRAMQAINDGASSGNNTDIEAPSNSDASNNMQIGRILTVTELNIGHWLGFMQEIIIYPTDQSSNREGIQTNINEHYNIY